MMGEKEPASLITHRTFFPFFISTRPFLRPAACYRESRRTLSRSSRLPFIKRPFEEINRKSREKRTNMPGLSATNLDEKQERKPTHRRTRRYVWHGIADWNTSIKKIR
jgi:hypothetical protein